MAGDGVLVVIEVTGDRRGGRDLALAPFGSSSVLGLQLERLAPLREVAAAAIVVAISDLPVDDPTAEVAAAASVPVVRGPADDVVGRYEIAHARYPTDAVVRLTTASPLIDPFLVSAVLDLHRASDADLTSNLLPRSYPRGLDVEVLSARALRCTSLETTEPRHRRHPTAYVRSRPERFRLANLDSGHALGAEDWSVATEGDLRRVTQLVGQVPDLAGASWNRILSIVGRSAPPRPGEVVLRPLASVGPGSDPWVQRWSIVIDGREVGIAQVSTHEDRVATEVVAAEEWRERAREALYAHLHLDGPAPA